MIRTYRSSRSFTTIFLLLAAVGLLSLWAGGQVVGASETRPLTMVLCAPGYPGSTEDAQPTMDQLAAYVAAQAGWAPARVQAVYHRTEDTGVPRIQEADVALAMVPLPFFVRYEKDLNLRPLLMVEPEGTADEVWSLVARRGLIKSPADLSGWEITGQPCYAPRFVRGPVLADWGALPADVQLTFSDRVLSSLRRAAGEEKVAVLLDREQTEALTALPFAGDLEIVTSSRPLPAYVVCAMGNGIDQADLDKMTTALRSMHQQEDGRLILEETRMKRFRPLDEKAMKRVRDLLALTDGTD
jgi:hypothetical protein